MIRLLALTLPLLVITSSAFADRSREAIQYICKELPNRGNFDKQTLVFTQIGTGNLTEGVKYPFKLQIFAKHNRQPIVSTTVTVETEDVMFGFESKKDDLSGMIYLDELDQASLTIRNQTRNFDCN